MRRLSALVLLLLSTLPAALAVQEPPARTDEGEFTGTWYRVQKGERQGLQIRRAESGGYEVSFYWWTEAGLEIDTDFAPVHEFAYKAFPGSLALEVVDERSDEGEIVLTFERRQDGSRGSQLEESGEVRLFRAVRGRHLAWVQDPLRVKVTIREPVTPREKAGVDRAEKRVWIFRKVARRMVSWTEIPW